MLHSRLLQATLVIATAAAATLPAARAQDLDGRAIVDKADKHNRAQDEKDQVIMTIISSRGEKRRRELTTYFKAGEGDDDRTLVRFDAPADVKGTGLLTIEQGASDEQFLYLPELRKSKRIAGATKSQSFMGTDFSNYDMRTEDLTAHQYKKTGEETIDGRACHVVEATPKDDEAAESTGYSRRLMYVDKERWVVPKVEYYDRSAKLLKVLTTEGWKQHDGLWRPMRVTMENKQEGSKTIIAFDKGREINKGIADKVFSKRELENP
jgi:outer membrane lipoprotein-sorting protein